MKAIWASFVTLCVVGSPYAAHSDVVSQVLGCNGDPCIVQFSGGGGLHAFKAAAREIKRTGRRVVIDGPCLSACAVLADEARSRVCVTPRAKFGFHKGYALLQPTAGGPPYFVARFDPSHSRDIDRWVKKNGGYPSQGFRLMDPATAGRIWRKC